jgi:hypothetical protein
MSYRVHCALACLSVSICAAQTSPLVAGPWCGAVTSNSIAATANLSGSGLVARLAVSTQANFSGPVFSAAVTSQAASGNSVRLDLGGLQADTLYFYALEIGGVLQTAAGKTGSFRTLPAPGPASFRFCFASCGDWHESGQWVHQKIIAENPRFFIHMGDLNYEDTDEDDEEPYRENIINSITLSPELGELVRKVPTAWIWDDHDFSGNTSDRTSDGRRANRQVYRELIPHYPLPAGGPNAAIYQAFTCGRTRFILSDLRSDRDRDSDDDDEDKSMMGDAQKQWFKDELLAARDAEVPLIIWMSGVPTIQIGSVRDNWGSYATERKELLEFIRDQDIRNVVVISGDMHALAYDDGRALESYVTGGKKIPVFHAAALTRDGSEKGGPYSGGVSEGSGRYGVMDVADDGSQVSVTYAGRITTSASNLSTWKTYTHETVAVKPRRALDLAALASLSVIRVTWADDSTVETGYRIERRIAGGTTWDIVGSVAAGVSEFTDSSVSGGISYEYRVITLNGSAEALPSEVAVATASARFRDWKIQHFGDADTPDDDDGDGDGLSLVDEYLFDLNPQQADRYVWQASGSTVSFASSLGRSYRVEGGDSLAAWPVQSPSITGDGSVKEWTDPNPAGGGRRFYRVVVTESP